MANESVIISPKIREFLLSRKYDENFSISPIAGAGSGRQYFRIADKTHSSVLQVSSEVDENFKFFVDYSKTFRAYHLPVPQIYCVDESSAQILQEDLGTHSLLDEVSSHIAEIRSGSERIIYPVVIDALIEWQESSQAVFSSHSEIWLRRFDYASLKWETDYFTENYLMKHKGLKDIPQCVRNFYSLIAVSVDAQKKVLMHRDFQSQNILVKPNAEIAFVDYQGARRGSMFYDIASLLWDPYVKLPFPMIKDFFEYWRLHFKETKIYTQEDAWVSFIHASLQRLMQALGAYCFLSQVKKIEKFANFIEPGKTQLKILFEEFKKVAKATEPQVFDFMNEALS